MWDSNGRKFWAHNNRTFGTNDTNGHGRIKVIWCDPSGSHKDYPDDPGGSRSGGSQPLIPAANTPKLGPAPRIVRFWGAGPSAYPARLF